MYEVISEYKGNTRVIATRDTEEDAKRAARAYYRTASFRNANKASRAFTSFEGQVDFIRIGYRLKDE